MGTASRRRIALSLVLCWGLMWPLQAWSGAAAPAAQQGDADEASQIAVFEVLLDGHVLSDSLAAYQDEDRFLLPLGELARLLTLAITVDAKAGQASGYVIREERGFGLNVPNAVVSVEGRTMRVDPRDVRVIGDDIHVSHKVLREWLPLDLAVDLPTLQLRIKPRVLLPLQERLQRERAGKQPGMVGSTQDDSRTLVRQEEAFALLRAPFIDQTFGSDARFGRGSAQYKSAYAAYMTADLLGMEAEAYVSSSREHREPDLRWTLSRHDPEGRLLGLARAQSLSIGHVLMPSVAHVAASSQGGAGAMVSNRALGQPMNFDSHSIRGNLSPGWDVTLYYNDALVGYQPSSSDGRYAFDDLPLSFGPNEFRLVFNGPLGQVRVERQNFLLDQSVMKPGELVYAVAGQSLVEGGHVGVAQFDLGLTDTLSANIGVLDHARGAAAGGSRTYVQTGLRGYLQGVILNGRLTQSPGGGWLADMGVKSRIGRHAVSWEHVRRGSRFRSDQHVDGPDGLHRRDRVGIQGSVHWADGPPLSLALEGGRDTLVSRENHDAMAARASTMLAGTAVTQSVRWQRQGERQSLDGSMQFSKRVAEIGLSGQIDFGVKPHATMRTVAFTADHQMRNGCRLNVGLLYSKLAEDIHLSAGVSKNFGGFALALTGGISNKGERTLAMQMFVAMGRDPRSNAWFMEPQPLAGTGAVSLQAFVDKNMNGLRDAAEEAVPNAGFLLNNGGRHPGRTDAQGRLFVSRLPPGQFADIELDASTLEDPQWKSVLPGVRVLPRPGLVQPVDFPVVYTAEVEGTVFLVDAAGRRRGIGDARLELVDPQGRVLATTRSSPDGYYLLHQVMPGPATLRIAPEQAIKLGLSGALSRDIEIPADGDFLSGQDIELQMLAR